MKINNDMITLQVLGCDSKKVRFLLKRKVTVPSQGITRYLADRVFDFDFRYYEPYRGSEMVPSGLYVFKTSDKDSREYPHVIERIKAFQGKLV